MRGRSHSAKADDGETLIEIVLTVVITAITITALISSLATTGSAAQAQRNRVSADAVMRNYAEAIKAGVHTCVGGPTYAIAFTPPTGFTVSVAPVSATCPLVTATQTLTLTTSGPAGTKQTMQIKVRRP